MATPTVIEKNGVKYVQIPFAEVNNYSQFMLTGMETLHDVLGTVHNYINRFRMNFVPGATDHVLDAARPTLVAPSQAASAAAAGAGAVPVSFGTGLAGVTLAAPLVDEAGGKRRRKREKKPKDPNAPKRPLTAYFLFLQSARADIRESLGHNATAGEISEEATRRWKELTDDEKTPWKESYNRAWAEFDTKMKEYKAQAGEAAEGAVAAGDELDADADAEEETFTDAPQSLLPGLVPVAFMGGTTDEAAGRKGKKGAAAASPRVAKKGAKRGADAVLITDAAAAVVADPKKRKSKDAAAVVATEEPKRKKAKKGDDKSESATPAASATAGTAAAAKKKSSRKSKGAADEA